MLRSTIVIAAALCAACPGPDSDEAEAAPGGGSAYRGTITFAHEGNGNYFNPGLVVDLDVATSKETLRYEGWDPHRNAGGETAYLTRLAPGYVSDVGVVVADARGVPGAPLFVCPSFSFTSNRICHTPKVSPDGKLVAVGTAAGGGKVCRDGYGTWWADYVVVRDRKGNEVTRFEGYNFPEWLPDGRLLMLGSACRGAGVWIAGARLDTAVRVDGDEIGTQARLPAVSPDGKKVALVWNNQLWSLSLDGRHDLAQLTQTSKPVASAAWSPDGKAIAVLLWDISMPVRALLLFRPGIEGSEELRPLPYYPYGPMTWR